MAEMVKYYAKRNQKYFFEYEMKLMWGDYKNNKKHESKQRKKFTEPYISID